MIKESFKIELFRIEILFNVLYTKALKSNFIVLDISLKFLIETVLYI